MSESVTINEQIAAVERALAMIREFASVGEETIEGVPTLRTIAGLEAALATLRAVRQWTPIDSAPMDGNEIILGMPEDAFAGFWHDGAENYWKQAGWYAEMDRSNLLTAKLQMATHWMPLPAPPSEGGRK